MKRIATALFLVAFISINAYSQDKNYSFGLDSITIVGTLAAQKTINADESKILLVSVSIENGKSLILEVRLAGALAQECADLTEGAHLVIVGHHEYRRGSRGPRLIIVADTCRWSTTTR